MVKTGGACLYKEARLNIEPAFPGSTIALTLPASSTSTFGLRTPAKRTIVSEQPVDQDEDTFAKRHLASDGSMFFRRHHQYPRSFLWRILEGRKVLEIQSTDLDHDASNRLEANLTLLLQFSAPIRPFCVAFAEPEDRDALVVFAVTTASELYTITLDRDFFIKPAASEQEMSTWCNRFSNNLIQSHVPYRLSVVNANDLLVSLNNGGILRLTRNGCNEPTWTESYYHQNHWVRGLLSWKGHPTVRYENVDLEVSSAVAVELSPDRKHLLTVSLDHKLKVWNVETGKLGIQMDLLGPSDRDQDKVPSYFIGASQSTLMSIANIPGGVDGALYFIVTYSPKRHQFKFWGVRDADDLQFGLYDAKPQFDFIPPVDELMDATVWTMEEFYVKPGPASWRGTELWIRARSGPSSKVYSLQFDLNEDISTLSRVWRDEWVSVDSGPMTVDALKRDPLNPSGQDQDTSAGYHVDLTEKWLDFLFRSGRFTVSTLEAALLIYRRGLDRTRPSRSLNKGPLKERISATVAAFTAKEQNDSSDLDGFDNAVGSQWEAFYGLVKDLHKRRGECLSLVYDSETDQPWLVLSDYISAIRQCSDHELSALNASAFSSTNQPIGPLRRSLLYSGFKDVSRLLNAASTFRKRFPSWFQKEVQSQVEFDLLQSRPLTVADRMDFMEANCDLSQMVTDEDLSIFVEELGSELKHLSTDTFIRAMQTLEHEEQGRQVRRKQVARYGLNALVRVSQETLETNYNILLDLLVIVLYMQYEEDISDEFDASEVFVELVAHFKDCQLLTWMSNTVWSHPSPTGPASEELLKTLHETFKSSSKFPIVQTVLEGIYGHHSFDFPIPRGLRTEQLTYWARAWISGVFKDSFFDGVVENVMGILLFQREYDLALHFSKFLPDGNWATYLKGRMHLALSNNEMASICFQKAAYNLALGLFSVDDSDTGHLVPEIEHDSFSEGLPKYYHHILGLFEKHKAYSFVGDFAKLGLRTLRGREDEELRTDLLQRLFTASIKTTRFEEAYLAMTLHRDLALKHSALQTLMTAMIQHSQAPTLLKFPFVGLADEVDAILTSHCNKTLNLASGPPYHQILYSFRISRNNFRGAASILYERLQRLKTSSSKVHDPADESLTHCYLMIINTLSLVNEKDAYILAEQRIDDVAPSQWGIGKAKKMLKRQIVTLDSLRKEYQAELDRVAAIESGQFPFVETADEMDVL